MEAKVAENSELSTVQLNWNVVLDIPSINEAGSLWKHEIYCVP